MNRSEKDLYLCESVCPESSSLYSCSTPDDPSTDEKCPVMCANIHDWGYSRRYAFLLSSVGSECASSTPSLVMIAPRGLPKSRKMSRVLLTSSFSRFEPNTW